MRKKATAISLLDCGAADAGDSARPPATSSVQKAKDFKGIRIRNDSSQDTGWRFASLQIKDGVPAHFPPAPWEIGRQNDNGPPLGGSVPGRLPGRNG